MEKPTTGPDSIRRTLAEAVEKQYRHANPPSIRGITAEDVEHTMEELLQMFKTLNIDQQDKDFLAERTVQKLDIWRTALQPE